MAPLFLLAIVRQVRETISEVASTKVGQSHVREIKAHFEVKVPYLPASMLLPLQSPMVNPCEKEMV